MSDYVKRPTIGPRGEPWVDPTPNVIALVEANAKAASALRDADVKFNDATAAHLKEIGMLRAQHAKETREFDTAQSANIRDVDMANAEKTAAQILQAVNTNAAVAERTAKTLQDQVASTAAAQENRQASFAADMMKRLSAVELSISKGEGKQQVADPAMAAALMDIKQLLSARPPGPDAETIQLRADVRALLAAKNTATDQKQGALDQRTLLTWAMGILIALMAFYTFSQRQTPAPVQPPQVIMVPAVPGTLVPTPTSPVVPR